MWKTTGTEFRLKAVQALLKHWATLSTDSQACALRNAFPHPQLQSFILHYSLEILCL